jgi:hypothetical protein
VEQDSRRHTRKIIADVIPLSAPCRSRRVGRETSLSLEGIANLL